MHSQMSWEYEIAVPKFIGLILRDIVKNQCWIQKDKKMIG
jgi:hypothetical protein